MTSPYSEEWVIGPKATAFYTRTYNPAEAPKAAIVFLHGFVEHIGRYEAAFPQYSAKSISVFAFDQRGFGRTVWDEEHRSKDSKWASTHWDDQREDIIFFVKREKERVGKDIPLFLMGHSMGGGESLNFVCFPPSPKDSMALLSGVIACSPLVRQTTPISKVTLWRLYASSLLFPDTFIDSPVDPDALSRDPIANKAYMEDPLIKPKGTLRGLSNMLFNGIILAEQHYKNYPPEMPLLLLHGDNDTITSYKASEKFINDINAKDKHLVIMPGGYHELAQEPDLKEKLIEEVTSWIFKHISTGAEARL
ncbi:alpha/beta-hydrolase [Clavulina sp. PMI_390]|nr:alpha/beta-hydrolase [Clavulina sp. PMI_390]